MSMGLFFEVTPTPENNYLVILYRDGKEIERNCLGNHAHAVSWGQRAKMRNSPKHITGKSYVFDFGKYKGLTLASVLRSDPGYILWMHENNVAEIPEDIIIEAEILEDE